MFRIGEFSKLTQVSARMLRYYDEAGLLKPAWIDKDTGYRMYTVEQIPILNKIVYLRDSGFQIAEIALAIKQVDDSKIIEQLTSKYTEIEAEIDGAKAKLRKIEIAKDAVLHPENDLHYQITMKQIPSYSVLSLRKVVNNYFEEGTLWKEISQFVKKEKIAVTDQSFAMYHDEEYKETEVDIEVCAVVHTLGVAQKPYTFRSIEPVVKMACMMVYGDFSNIAKAFLSFAQWLKDHSEYEMQGANRQIVHRGPWNESDPSNYLIEIQIPLQPTKQ